MHGFTWLMLVIGLVSLGMGLFFLSIGAWPVFGFFGLDVALLYVAFRINFRDGEIREHVVLDAQDLSITRSGPKETPYTHHFQPAWVKVQVHKRPGQVAQLRLSAHGKSLVVGGFLPPGEINQVAGLIENALNKRAQALSA